MTDEELGLALAFLRMIRGWSQEELAKASGIRSGSISDYERNRMVPGLKTLQKLMDAMGYPLSMLSQTQRFIEGLKTEALLTGETRRKLPAPEITASPQLLRREVEQVSAEAGRVVTRLTHLMLALVSQSARDNSEP
jgi:transcriptional regulator with XRE-family HTH domain